MGVKVTPITLTSTACPQGWPVPSKNAVCFIFPEKEEGKCCSFSLTRNRMAFSDSHPLTSAGSAPYDGAMHPTPNSLLLTDLSGTGIPLE
eukprot:scaffold96551_cov22-Tisochrysis_lutea.AAC.1